MQRGPAPKHSSAPHLLPHVSGLGLKAAGSGGVRQAIEAAGAMLLYLPAYSPDFNPIEMAFSKLKALLGAAAARAIHDPISA
jgi:transposase